jgi:glycosyltransferase involved in cell wall biosynthesis
MRIAVVTETFPPEINGVAHSIGRICLELCRLGIGLQIVRPAQTGEAWPFFCGEAEHVRVWGVRLPNYREVRLGWPSTSRLERKWRENPPALVHIVTEGPLGWSALRAAKKLGLRVTSGFHTNFHGYATHYGAGWLTRTALRYLRHFHNQTETTLVPTAQLREELLAKGFGRLAVLGRGVDTQLFDPARRDAALRTTWGADEKTLVVLHVGRLAAEKNLATLFHTFEEIRRKRSDARLVVVGDGPLRLPLEREHPGHVYTGMLRGETLAAHYASADVFLYPSLTETFGNVTLEAIASGLAVVAFDYAAAREHLVHMESGVLAPYGDDASFARLAVMLAESPRMIRSLGREARLAAAHLGWDAIARSFLAETLGWRPPVKLSDPRSASSCLPNAELA